MDRVKIDALNNNRVDLCNKLDNMLEILNYLQRDGMTQYTVEKILSCQTRYERAYELVTWLTKKTNEVFDEFLEALDNTCQTHLKDSILNCMQKSASVQEAALQNATLSVLNTSISSKPYLNAEGATAGCNPANDAPGYIIVVGGKDHKLQMFTVCYAYSIETNNWIELPRIPNSLFDINIVTLSGKVYVVGLEEEPTSQYTALPPTEENGRKILSAKKFDKNAKMKYSLKIIELCYTENHTENQWKYRNDISSAYSASFFEGESAKSGYYPPHMSAASLNQEDLYVIRKGGDGLFFDKLDANLKWTKLDYPWNTILSMTSLNGILYATDGYTLHTYDPSTNRWGNVTEMKRSRASTVALVACNYKLYVVGGDGLQRGECESYDSETKQWTRIEHMIRIWAGCALASDGRRIYAIGGEDCAFECVNDVEMYVPEKDNWTSVAPYPIKIMDAMATFVKRLRSGYTASFSTDET